MLEFLISNWFLVLLAFAGIAVMAYAAYVFIKRPTSEQIFKVKEWLLWAVVEAERELGSGTGQIKLRYVYDMFIAKFPYLAKVIPFETFSILVDEVLEKFRELLNTNIQLKEYIKQ